MLIIHDTQLQSGMRLELRPCLWCGNNEEFTLLEKDNTIGGTAKYPDGERVVANSWWTTTKRCSGELDAYRSFDRAIEEQRLYVLE